MDVAPRYITRPSQDLTFFDLLDPATEWDFEEAVTYHLRPLAAVSWRLNRRRSRILSTLRKEWRCDATTVKDRLLRIALPHVLALMRDRQRVRFGPTWLRDARGDLITLEPARDLGHVRMPNESTRYHLEPRPTAKDVDAFGRWIEQALLRKAAALLDERGDVLADAREWYDGRDRDDALARDGVISTDDASSSLLCERMEDSTPDVHHLAAEYENAVSGLTCFGEGSEALLDLFMAVNSDEEAWSRKHDTRRRRMEMNLRQLVAAQPEVVPLVHRAWEAAAALRDLGVPLPEVKAA